MDHGHSVHGRREYITYIESSPFNLHRFQHLLYCTLVYEIAKGLPPTLVCSFVGRLGPESRGWATICRRDDWILICLRFGASEDGRIVGRGVEIVRHESRAQGFKSCFKGIGAFGAEDIPLLSLFA